VLFSGTVNRDVGCSSTWLAEHEYAIQDVNKSWFPARSGHRAGATSWTTHGDLSRDEPRASFVSGETYWGRRHLPARQRPVLVHRRRRAVLIFPAAGHWIAQLVEEPPPGTPS
jgi:hypothetical protein